jgi:hypothetical protein
MKFTNFTASLSTDFNSLRMRFEARACLWMLQYVQEMFDATIFVRAHKSVIIPCHWFGPIHADAYATRPMYLIFLEIFDSQVKNIFSSCVFFQGAAE